MIYLNGKLVEDSEDKVSLRAAGVQLGLGVFETMLAVGGAIDGFDLHLERLCAGAGVLGYDVERVGELEEAVRQVLEANNLSDKSSKAKVRITTMDGVCMVTAEPAPERSSVCNVVMSEFVRNERSALVGVKCSSYAENILALRAAQEEGADEAILLNSNGEVAEATAANVFVVQDEEIYTPRLESGCLPGVTRELVMRRCAAAGYDVIEDVVLFEDIVEADEVFLTNSLVGVRGVANVGDMEISDGCGEITEMVRELYHDGDQ